MSLLRGVRPLPQIAVVGVIVLAALSAACGGGTDPYAPVASVPTINTSFVVYPISKAPAPYSPALDLRSALPVRPVIVLSSATGSLVPNFDVAFDIDASGRVLLLPPKLVTAAQTIPRTGFQSSSTAYASLGSAPGGTYLADSTFAVALGQTVVIQAQGACSLASPFYAKIVVDSVSPATGGIYLRATIDPNCGFKSFASGLPTS